MKFANKLLMILVMGLAVTSCYDDYVHDYEDPNMGFAVAQPLRTVIAERNMSIYIGVSIGGKREVDMNDWAKFTIDASLVEGTGKVLLPSTHYTLADSEFFRVRKSNLPVADVQIDFTEAFYNDPLSYQEHYALPFRMTENSIGSIREGGETTVAVIKCANAYAGSYYRMGTTTELDESDTPIAEPVNYGNTYDIVKCSATTSRSLTRNSLQCPGLANNINTGGLTINFDAEGKLTVTGIDGQAPVRDASGSYTKEGKYEFVASPGKIAPEFDLEYKFTHRYTENKVEIIKYYHVVEKLVLRQDPLNDLRVETWQ